MRGAGLRAQCTLHDFRRYYSGLVVDSLTHWLNPTISARLIFAWQAHVNMFELFKDITSEMFPSTWLSTGYRRKNTGWNKADCYNNKQNLLCFFKGPCLSLIILSLFYPPVSDKPTFWIYFEIYPSHLHSSVMLLELKSVATVCYHKTWSEWWKWRKYQTNMRNISAWQFGDKKGLTVPPCPAIQLSHQACIIIFFLFHWLTWMDVSQHLRVVQKIIFLSPAPSSSSLLSLS